jgi:Rps23 Pro-64 3,4-dihydroxylase Tpa1-like proline 4-hydroxylase
VVSGSEGGSEAVIDHRIVSPWIQSQHLEEDAIRAHREAFTSHPARLIFIRDFLVESMAEKLTRFLRDEGEFRFEYGLYSDEDPVSEEVWAKAPADDQFFRLGKLIGTPPQFQMSPNALTYLRFRQTFQRLEFKGFFEAITGMTLGSSDDFGAHFMRVGDFLKSHSDDNRDRRLALVLYLTPDWQPNFGGELRVVEKNGAVHTIQPEYNSMVAFDVLTETSHYIEPIQAVAGDQARLTIGGWYHRPE